MKKFFTREVKIGLVFIIAIAVLFFGLNFLKGINIFTPSNHYFAKYQNVGGLVSSNAVMIKGYKVGQVRAIKYNFACDEPFVVEIFINDDIKLPKGTVFTLADEGLMGGKIINISLGENDNLYQSGDTVPTTIEGGLMAQLGDIVSSLKNSLNNLDTVVNVLKLAVNSPSLQSGINSLGSTLVDLNKTVAQIKSATATLPNTMDKVNNIATNFDKKIEELDINSIVASLEKTLADLQNFTKTLDNKDSSLGLLLNDRGMYDNLNTTIQSATNLLVDLKQNPKRYVNITVFGKKEKKEKNEKK
ncbi:MAG: MlaD family protein [Prevotellaceae bacterium]|jgi:phospholipid/cholesterol/gamma-HCH transport system substrate-binding protein|nr:MlaD family protein [Prevotellaceae bacterium]